MTRITMATYRRATKPHHIGAVGSVCTTALLVCAGACGAGTELAGDELSVAQAGELRLQVVEVTSAESRHVDARSGRLTPGILSGRLEILQPQHPSNDWLPVVGARHLSFVRASDVRPIGSNGSLPPDMQLASQFVTPTVRRCPFFQPAPPAMRLEPSAETASPIRLVDLSSPYALVARTNGGIAIASAHCLEDARALTLAHAPAGEWTHVDVPEARCMQGEAPGLFINRNPTSDNLMVFMAPGGACFDGETCQQYFESAAAKLLKRPLRTQLAILARQAITSRRAVNPFSTWNLAYIPYCSGDVFAGAQPYGDETGFRHTGYVNARRYFHLLSAAFPNLDRVVLAGMSAGGFGAVYNLSQAADAFGDVQLDVINDSAPPLSGSYLLSGIRQQWQASWNLNSNLPEGCCRAAPDGVVDYADAFFHILRRNPATRVLLTVNIHDRIMRTFFGRGYPHHCSDGNGGTAACIPVEAFDAGVRELGEEAAAQGLPNLRIVRIADADEAQHGWVLSEPDLERVAAEIESFLGL